MLHNSYFFDKNSFPENAEIFWQKTTVTKCTKSKHWHENTKFVTKVIHKIFACKKPEFWVIHEVINVIHKKYDKNRVYIVNKSKHVFCGVVINLTFWVKYGENNWQSKKQKIIFSCQKYLSIIQKTVVEKISFIWYTSKIVYI